jgi:hypothetical protein
MERWGFSVGSDKKTRSGVIKKMSNREEAAMKRTHLIISILLFTLAISFDAIETYAADVEIKNVSVDQTFDSSLWAIKGTVRNLESRPIKGYVKIKFLNANGQIFKSAATAVNDATPLDPNQIGNFLYPAFKSYFTRAVNFQVNFVEVEIKVPKEPLSPVLR